MAVSPELQPLPLGKGRVVMGNPEDPGVLVLSAGTVLKSARDAVGRAQESGIQATLFDVRYVKPLDAEAIVGLSTRAQAVITVEENTLVGGFGAAVLECLVDSGTRVPRMRRLGLPDAFIEHGSQEELLREVGLDTASILAAIQEMAEAARGT